MGMLQKHTLDEYEIHNLLKNLQPHVRYHSKKDVLKQNSFKKKTLYLLLEGILYVYTQNEYYDNELTTYFAKGNLFSESILMPYDNQTIRYIICKTDCRIAEIDLDAAYQYIIPPSESDRAISLLEFSYQSIVFRLEQHCHILQQKTVRNKIMAYLQYEADSQKNRSISLKIPYSDISSYLQTDRSCLMKELTRMVSDGLIQKSGKTVILSDRQDL